MRPLSNNGSRCRVRCCHEVPQIMSKNQQVFEKENFIDPITCITNNPGFKTVCLNRLVLEAAWFQY